MNSTPALVGRSTFAKKLLKDLSSLSGSDSPLLLIGPPGSGKAHVARIIHTTSGRKTMLVLDPRLDDMASLSSRLESTERSAETILIRRIDAFSYLQQGVIAAFLQKASGKVPYRVIVTSQTSVDDGLSSHRLAPAVTGQLVKFRQIVFPNLTDRSVDIVPLATEFVAAASQTTGSEPKLLDARVGEFLSSLHFEENIRTLKTLVERMVVESEGEYLDLPRDICDEVAQTREIATRIELKQRFTFDKSLNNLERSFIERTLATVGFNQVKAAAILGLSEANFRYRMKKFGLWPKRERTGRE